MKATNETFLPIGILFSAARCLLALALPMAFNSCTTVDPEYPALLAMAEANPAHDAVVGMWHRKSNDYGYQWSMNVLFQRNGTGQVESHVNDASFLGSGEHTDLDTMGAFTWKYQGAGVWTLTSVSNSSKVEECRIAGGKLLRHIKHFGREGLVTGLFVYTPVHQ